MNNFKLTNNAATRIKELQKNEEVGSLFRISVLGGGCSGFQYDFSFTKEINDDDIIFCDFDVNYLIDKTSIEFIKEGSLDFVQELGGSFFKIENLLDRKNIVNRGGGTSENLGYKSPDMSIYLGIKFTN